MPFKQDIGTEKSPIREINIVQNGYERSNDFFAEPLERSLNQNDIDDALIEANLNLNEGIESAKEALAKKMGHQYPNKILKINSNIKDLVETKIAETYTQAIEAGDNAACAAVKVAWRFQLNRQLFLIQETADYISKIAHKNIDNYEQELSQINRQILDLSGDDKPLETLELIQQALWVESKACLINKPLTMVKELVDYAKQEITSAGDELIDFVDPYTPYLHSDDLHPQEFQSYQDISRGLNVVVNKTAQVIEAAVQHLDYSEISREEVESYQKIATDLKETAIKITGLIHESVQHMVESEIPEEEVEAYYNISAELKNIMKQAAGLNMNIINLPESDAERNDEILIKENETRINSIHDLPEDNLSSVVSMQNVFQQENFLLKRSIPGLNQDQHRMSEEEYLAFWDDYFRSKQTTSRLNSNLLPRLTGSTKYYVQARVSVSTSDGSTEGQVEASIYALIAYCLSKLEENSEKITEKLHLSRRGETVKYYKKNQQRYNRLLENFITHKNSLISSMKLNDSQETIEAKMELCKRSLQGTLDKGKEIEGVLQRGFNKKRYHRRDKDDLKNAHIACKENIKILSAEYTNLNDIFTNYLKTIRIYRRQIEEDDKFIALHSSKQDKNENEFYNELDKVKDFLLEVRPENEERKLILEKRLLWINSHYAQVDIDLKNNEILSLVQKTQSLVDESHYGELKKTIVNLYKLRNELIEQINHYKKIYPLEEVVNNKFNQQIEDSHEAIVNLIQQLTPIAPAENTHSKIDDLQLDREDNSIDFDIQDYETQIPVQLSADDYYLLADDFFNQYEYTKSIDSLNAALEIDSDHVRSISLLKQIGGIQKYMINLFISELKNLSSENIERFISLFHISEKNLNSFELNYEQSRIEKNEQLEKINTIIQFLLNLTTVPMISNVLINASRDKISNFIPLVPTKYLVTKPHGFLDIFTSIAPLVIQTVPELIKDNYSLIKMQNIPADDELKCYENSFIYTDEQRVYFVKKNSAELINISDENKMLINQKLEDNSHLRFSHQELKELDLISNQEKTWSDHATTMNKFLSVAFHVAYIVMSLKQMSQVRHENNKNLLSSLPALGISICSLSSSLLSLNKIISGQTIENYKLICSNNDNLINNDNTIILLKKHHNVITGHWIKNGQNKQRTIVLSLGEINRLFSNTDQLITYQNDPLLIKKIALQCGLISNALNVLETINKSPLPGILSAVNFVPTLWMGVRWFQKEKGTNSLLMLLSLAAVSTSNRRNFVTSIPTRCKNGLSQLYNFFSPKVSSPRKEIMAEPLMTGHHKTVG